MATPRNARPGMLLDPGAPINQGLVGWWPMWEGAGGKTLDISGENNHGTLTNGPLWADGGLKFDGTDDYLAGPANVVTAFPASIHVRVMLLNVSATTKMIVQTCDSAAAADYYQGAQLSFSSSGFGASTGDGAGGAAANRKSLLGTTAPVVNTWYSITCVFISHGNYIIYLNGVNDGGSYSGTAATSVFTSDPLSIGRWDSDLDRFANMIVSGCRIWTRGLSQQEAQLLHVNPNAGLWVPDVTRYYIPAAGGSVAASAGTSVVSGAGASTAASFGTVSGASTVTATGASTAASAASAGGTSTVAASGASTVKAVGTAAGTSTVSGVGTSTGSGSVASASGTGTVTGAGAATAAGVASAAGVSTVSATGAALASGVGVSAGLSTVSGIGASTAEGVGQSSGTSSVSGVGALTASATAAAAGASSALATGASTVDAVANAAGASTASGVSSAPPAATIINITVAAEAREFRIAAEAREFRIAA